MADEAEEFMWINGSEGMTARCVTHLGHYLDGSRSVASHRGRDRAPTMYLPKLVMDRNSVRFRDIDGEVGTPATEPDNSYREEDNVSLASKLVDDEDVLNLKRRTLSDSAKLKTRDRCLKLGTWNVRTLYQAGKLDNLIQEMENMRLDILGISETHWVEEGKIIKENHTLIYSGGKEHRKGVGILMKNYIARSMLGFWAISERVILLKLQAKPFNINIIQVYAPTSDCEDEEVEKLYQEINNGIQQTKSGEVLCVMGDFNAKVGKEKYEKIIGTYGLGNRNERGDRLIEFCQQNKLCVVNTWFQQPTRRLYTWNSPGGTTRNQIDYILINDRFRNNVKQVKTYPGADINSDHIPVVMKLKIKLKKMEKPKVREQFDLQLLKEENYKKEYNVEIRNAYSKLSNQTIEQTPEDQNDVEKKWGIIKESLNTSLRTVLPNKHAMKKKPWMTDDILMKMEERKKCKNIDSDKYKQLNKEIEKICRQTKEKWYADQCEEIELLEKQYKTREMHKKVKDLTNRNSRKTASGYIKDKNGKLLFDQEDIAIRWAEYITELYNDDRGEMPSFEVTSGKNIMKEEVELVIKSMKEKKATGPDGLSTEALKALDDQNVDMITDLCNTIYNSGKIPTDLKHSVFVTIPKKSRAQDCSSFRTISLMSHVTKLLLKVIQRRLTDKIDQEVSRLQSGFRPGVGTREGIFNLRTICERALEVRKDIYICFIDYAKAFDKVKHSEMIECLSEIGINDKDLQIITKLYWEQTATVRTENGVTKEFQIKKGVRQGCVLSPSLFNLYTEKIFREVEEMNGVIIGGVNINNLRYADDTVLLAENNTDLQELVTAINDKGKRYGMEMNITKTKGMIVSKKETVPEIKINIEGESIQQVKEMIYLGFMATENGKCEREIKRRIGVAKSSFEKMHKVLTSRNINITGRLRLTKCYVWSTLLYGAETWTLSKATVKNLEAFEMWTYRRIMKISWKEYKSNKEVLNMINSKRMLVDMIKRKKLAYFGHLVRRDNIQRLLLDGKIDGKRSRGKQRLTWADNITEWIGMKYSECIRIAQDRRRWRSMTADLLGADGTG